MRIRTIVVSFVCLLLALLALVWVFEGYSRRMAAEQTDQFAQFIAPLMWSVDEPSAKQYLEVISRVGGYRAIEAEHENGDSFVSYRSESQPGIVEKTLRSLGLVRERTFVSDVSYQGVPIGRIRALWLNPNLFTYVYFFSVGILVWTLVVLSDFFWKAEKEKVVVTEALSESQRRLSSVVAGAPIILFSLDRNGVFTLCEGKALEKVGIRSSEILGQPIHKVFPNEPGIVDDFHRALRGETVKSIRRFRGRVLEARLTRTLQDDGEVERVIGVSTDVTALQHAMDELAQRDESMRQELSLAHKIQRALLPARLPNIPGLEFGMIFVPSGDIGGDFVDFIEFKDPEKLGVVFADITGHGVPAALLSAMFKVMLDEVLAIESSPAACFSILNDRLGHEFPTGNFASTFYAVFDMAARVMTYVKAAQEPAILLRSGEPVRLLEEGGPVLGILAADMGPAAAYQEHQIPLREGDTVVFYTDGLVEFESGDGTMLERETLIQWMREELEHSPQVLANRLYSRALKFAGRADLPDDIALLAVRVTAPDLA